MTAANGVSRASARRPWLVVFGAIFVCSWCGNQFSPLLLLYKEEQHFSSVTVNSFLGVYVLGLAPALLVAGALSDRHGRRPVMLAGIVTALAASAALSLSGLGIATIYGGRLLAGVTVGIAMSVGTSWVKELSQAPHDLAADGGSGARRSSLAFTLGSAAGALVAGAIAQFAGAVGEWLPFVLHILLTVPFLRWVSRLPETSITGGEAGSVWAQLRVPAASHRRFRRVVLVAAPWIFAAAAIAYGYLPVLLSDRTGEWGLGYATLLCVVALGAASLVQPLAKKVDTVASARGLVVCLVVMVVGFAVLTLSVSTGSLVVGLVSAAVLGCGMGIGLVSGLLEVQRIASPRDLAGLTGVFYAVAYAGFLAPTLLAAITPPFTTVLLLMAVAVLAVVSVVVVLVSSRRHLPAR